MGGPEPLLTAQVVVLRLLVAVALGALLGLERERRERPAGLRTHILVTVTACLGMIVAADTLDASNAGRVAQGILTGIGFLGAGTILRQRSGIQGLTTAASIWAASALGVAAGLGAYVQAGVAALLVFGALTLLHPIENRLHLETGVIYMQVRLKPGASFPSGLERYLADNGLVLLRLETEPDSGCWRLEVDPGTRLSVPAALALVHSAPGIETVDQIAPGAMTGRRFG